VDYYRYYLGLWVRGGRLDRKYYNFLISIGNIHRKDLKIVIQLKGVVIGEKNVSR